VDTLILEWNYKATLIALKSFACCGRPDEFGDPTTENFLKSINTTNRIVAYDGHIQSLTPGPHRPRQPLRHRGSRGVCALQVGIVSCQERS